ncbi:MAG: hypothetical protein ABI777_00310 [Betaproteobacteria bacterium]
MSRMQPDSERVKVGKRQRILLTKLFPPAIKLRATRDFDAILNPQDRKWGNTLPAAAAGPARFHVAAPG